MHVDTLGFEGALTRPAVRQIAYFVADAAEAARAHHTAFGSGPYLLAEHIPLTRCLYRGREAEFDHTSAYGQWGDVMVEFVQQNNPGPSCCHDVYPEGSGRYGIHHVALFVEDIDAEIARHAAAGHAVAMDASSTLGTRFVMVDTVARFGHMLELYHPHPGLAAFYARVAGMAGDFAQGVVVGR
jgi:hypothetical protein